MATKKTEPKPEAAPAVTLDPVKLHSINPADVEQVTKQLAKLEADKKSK